MTVPALVLSLVGANLSTDIAVWPPFSIIILLMCARMHACGGGAGSHLSKGGMLTKVLAAKVAAQTGASTVIASGKEDYILTRLLSGESIGTRLQKS